MQLILEVPDAVVQQFGAENLKTYLLFKLENMVEQKNKSEAKDSEATIESTPEQVAEAWEKVRKMGMSC
jgi:hypothetical protein